MKPPASGSSSKSKRPYYLTEFIQFALPFIRALGTPVGNLSDCPQQSLTELAQDSEDQTQNEVYNDEENEDFQLSHVDNDLSPPNCPTQLPSCPIQVQQDNVSNEKSLSDTYKIPPTPKKGKFQKRANTDVDKSFMEYLNMKKKIETTPNECNQQKKIFLLSLLPEIEPMTNAQMSSFRRRVLQLIDDIMNPAPYLQLSTTNLST